MDQFGSWSAAIKALEHHADNLRELADDSVIAKVELTVVTECITLLQLERAREIYDYENEMARRENLSNTGGDDGI